jgi:hypothetical protein
MFFDLQKCRSQKVIQGVQLRTQLVKFKGKAVNKYERKLKNVSQRKNGNKCVFSDCNGTIKIGKSMFVSMLEISVKRGQVFTFGIFLEKFAK